MGIIVLESAAEGESEDEEEDVDEEDADDEDEADDKELVDEESVSEEVDVEDPSAGGPANREAKSARRPSSPVVGIGVRASTFSARPRNMSLKRHATISTQQRCAKHNKQQKLTSTETRSLSSSSSSLSSSSVTRFL